MKNSEFRPRHDQQTRQARILARLSMRTYRRELDGYKPVDLTRGLDSAFYLVEKLRSLAAIGGCAEANALIDHIQLKLAMASLGAATLLGTPVPSTRCNR